MNSKMFQEPKAPVKLPVTENVSSVLEAAKVSEEEITGCCFKGVFITKFDGKLLRFKKMAFENCKFISCFFGEASFTDVRFKNCDFSNTSLTDVYFKRCSFQSCKAVGADFYGSIMRHVTFLECNLSDMNLDASRMSYVRIKDTNLEESSLSKCGLDNLDLHQVKFAGASFFKTALKGVDMSDCDMDRIIISDGKEELRGAVLNMSQAIVCAKRMGIVIKELETEN